MPRPRTISSALGDSVCMGGAGGPASGPAPSGAMSFMSTVSVVGTFGAGAASGVAKKCMPPPTIIAPGMTAASSRPARVRAETRSFDLAAERACSKPRAAESSTVEPSATVGSTPMCEASVCTGPSSHSVNPSHPAVLKIFAPLAVKESVTVLSRALPNEKAFMAALATLYAPERTIASSTVRPSSSSSPNAPSPSMPPPMMPPTMGPPPAKAAVSGGRMDTTASDPASIMYEGLRSRAGLSIKSLP